jgi:hypothetical protein
VGAEAVERCSTIDSAKGGAGRHNSQSRRESAV